MITSVLSQVFQAESDVQVITGLHLPAVDSFFDVFYQPANHLGEWEDGVKQDIVLESDATSIKTELISKVVGNQLNLALELNPNLNIVRILIGLSGDPENNKGVADGDFRLVWSKNMKDNINLVGYEGWPCTPGTLTVEQLTNGGWVDLEFGKLETDLHAGKMGNQIAACSRKGEPTQIEVGIDLGSFGLDFPDRNNFAPVQYSILVEATDDTNNPTWYGWPETPSIITENNQIGQMTTPSYWTAHFDPSLPIFSGQIDIGIDHIELTQAVQTADNAMPLVLNKTSLARVFVNNPSDSDVSVEVQLYGYFFPLVTLIPLGVVSQTFSAPPSPDRANIGDSANFVLPAAWANVPILILKAVVTPIGFFDSARVNNQMFDAFTLEETHNLNTYIQRINIGSASVPNIPSDTFIDNARDAMTAIFPMANPYYNYLSWETLGVWDPSTTTKTELKAALTEVAGEIFIASLFLHLLGIDSLPFPDQIHGIAASNIHSTGGSSDPSWLGGTSIASFGSWGTSRELTMAHEIMHNLGPGLDTDPLQWGRHVGDTDISTWNYQSNTDFVAENPDWGCGASGTDIGWPRTTDEIGILGWDMKTGNLVPETHPDLMSYCQSGTTPTKWVSDYRWEQVFDYLKSYPSSPIIESAPRLKTNKIDFTLPWWYTNITAVQMLSGYLFGNGSAKLRPSYEVLGAMPSNPDPDPKSIVANLVVAFSDQTTETFPLAANFTKLNYIDEGSGLHPTVIPFDSIHFNVNVPKSGKTIDSITIKDLAGNTLDQLTTQGTLSASLTNFNMPQTIIRGSSNPVSWTLSVTGAAEYYTRLEYSPSELLPDGNVSNLLWIPLGVLGSSNSGVQDLIFDTLPGGDKAQFRILVSDGITTRVVQPQGDFKVPMLLPAIQFPNVSPVSTLGTTLSLRTSGNNPETGPLGSNSFYFQVKDENGVLRETVQGDVYVGQFREPGTYSVTAFAVDPITKQEVSETVEIFVEPTQNYLSADLWKEFQDAMTRHREGYTSDSTTNVSPVPLTAVLLAVIGVAYKSRKKE
jgi:hypothetical protein